MFIYLMIGIIIYLLFIFYPFLSEKNRTKGNVMKLTKQLIILICFLVAIFMFHIDIVIAIILFVIMFIIFDKRTYTKKRLIIYSSIIVVLFVVSYFILKEDDEYITKYIKEHPFSTSLYVAYNGEPIITYHSDIVRPLASTVKIMVALEYANQVAASKIDHQSLVSLEDLNKYYYENTDGGAHEQWLDEMEEQNEIQDGKVSLHQVAKGMIMYSSNANTDYLIDFLGIEQINKTIEKLQLQKHDPVYPIVSSLLISSYLKEDDWSEEQLLEQIKGLSNKEYKQITMEIHDELTQGNKIPLTEISMDIQKVWSDRLIGSTAEDYGVLLAKISNNQFPVEVNDVMRDLLEWPMEYNEGNKNVYHHIGMKGGSTAFILNQAAYIETIQGDKIEFVLLTDDLSSWEAFRIGKNLNAYLVKMVGEKEFREHVQQVLE